MQIIVRSTKTRICRKYILLQLLTTKQGDKGFEIWYPHLIYVPFILLTLLVY